MKTNSSSLLQVYFFSIVGIITLLTALLPHYVMGGGTCFPDSPYTKRHTLELADINVTAARLAKIRINNPSEETKIDITTRDWKIASIVKIVVVRDGQENEVVVDHTNGTLPRVLKKISLFKIYSKRVFKKWLAFLQGHDTPKDSNVEIIPIMQDGKVFLTIKLIEEGGVLLELSENAYNSFRSISNWKNVEWVEDTEALLKLVAEARDQESKFRQKKEDIKHFDNVFTSPEHIVLALAQEFNASPTGILQTLVESTLGRVFYSLSAQARQLREIEEIKKPFYQIIQELRPQDFSGGVNKREYPSNIERSAFFETEQQTDLGIEITYTHNLNIKLKESQILPISKQEEIKQVLNVFLGENTSSSVIYGQNTRIVDRFIDNISLYLIAAQDPNHPNHREALEIVPERLRENVSIHEFDPDTIMSNPDSGTVGAPIRGMKPLREDLIKYCTNGKRCILVVRDLNRLGLAGRSGLGDEDNGINVNSLFREIPSHFHILGGSFNYSRFRSLPFKDHFSPIRLTPLSSELKEQITERLLESTLREFSNLETQQKGIIRKRIIHQVDQHPALGDGVFIEGVQKVINQFTTHLRENNVDITSDKNTIWKQVDIAVSQLLGGGPLSLFVPERFKERNMPDLISQITKRIKGYNEFIDTAVNRIITSLVHSTSLSMLLVGPSGNGKTTLVRHIAKVLGIEIIEITGQDIKDMGVKVLKGSRDYSGSLAEQVREKPRAIVFIDETNLVPKPQLHDLETMLYDRKMTDFEGNEVYLENIIFIFALNPGRGNNEGLFTESSDFFKEIFREEYPTRYLSMTSEQNEQARQYLLKHDLGGRESLLGRMGDIDVLGYLTKESLVDIAKLNLETLITEQSNKFNLQFTFEDKLIEYMANEAFENASRREGARPLERWIKNAIENISTQIIQDTDTSQIALTTIHITVENDQILVRKNIEGSSPRREEFFIVDSKGGFSRSSTNTQQPTPPESEPEAPRARFDFFNRNG